MFLAKQEGAKRQIDSMPPSDPTSSTDSACRPERRRLAVHVRFPSSEGRRLRRPEPTSCPGEAPLWAERPILMERADGTYELIGTAENLQGLARWILSFGARAEVRSPDRLRRRVAAEARRICNRYDDQ